MRLLLATENRGKAREMRALLPPEYELVLPSELGITLDTEESGETFEENAREKARAACEKSGIPSVADDSGLCVMALGGAPGVRSKRFGAPELTDRGRCELLLNTLENTEQRAAKFVSVIVCRFPDGGEITARGECVGEIARATSGENGFGYDPVFLIPELRATMAELTPEQKNAVSHRGRAMRLFAEKLEEWRRHD